MSDLTYQSNHQCELENTISKLTSIIENSRDVLYSVYYNDFKYDFISPSAADIFGYTAKEIQEMNFDGFLQIIHGDFREIYRDHWLSLKDQNIRQNHSLEYKIRPKIGISRWLSDNHKLIFDENGSLVKLVGNVRDITDIKLVEDALDRSRDRLYKAIEATNDGMWDWKINTNKVYFDARFYTMLGYEPLEFPADMDEWMGRIHPDDIVGVKSLLNQHLDGKSDQWLIEYRFKAKNGTWIWLLNRGKVFERDDNDKPMRMVGVHSDITLQKKAEEELQHRNIELQTIYDKLQISEEKFRQLAENTQDIFWLSDEENIIYLNSAFDKIWGRSREEVIKNPSILNKWVHPDDILSFTIWVPFTVFKNKESYLLQYRIIKPDGEIRWLWTRMFPVYDERNHIYRIASITSDITDQKKIEETLIATSEKARESDRLKSAFLANISHEIRTPMNGIIGFAELLKDESLPVESRVQFVNIITKSSEQLLHLINDIIDISKIEANQVNIVKTDIYLRSFMSDLRVFYENEKISLNRELVEIITNIPAEDVRIVTDESRLRQILMNLISNALKFTEHGFVKFGFNILPDHKVEFSVEDSGMGIAPEMQSHIFKRFRQLDDTSTRKYGGTGLGLAICDGLVKILGGQISVKSEKGKGSTFYFTIPYIDKNTQQVTTKKAVSISDSYNWPYQKILVVEDDDINLEYINAVLIPTNVTVISAKSGEEAVFISNSINDIDLVLMDIRLPLMNGFEAFEIIHKQRPSLAVIAQTAFAMTEDSTRCLEAGFAEYISKPINRKKLLAMIDRHLKK
jgi:PAS domain S-box-containing protein